VRSVSGDAVVTKPFSHMLTPHFHLCHHHCRYARDLTEEARRGKQDPVIGRDDEIRRCIQVLNSLNRDTHK
jgi:ATP-dependent Clp protease ATP-binding subunit ClpA